MTGAILRVSESKGELVSYCRAGANSPEAMSHIKIIMAASHINSPPDKAAEPNQKQV